MSEWNVPLKPSTANLYAFKATLGLTLIASGVGWTTFGSHQRGKALDALEIDSAVLVAEADNLDGPTEDVKGSLVRLRTQLDDIDHILGTTTGDAVPPAAELREARRQLQSRFDQERDNWRRVEQRLADVKRKRAEVRARIGVAREHLKNFARTAWLAVVIIVIGAFLFGRNMTLWYERVQKPLDERARLPEGGGTV